MSNVWLFEYETKGTSQIPRQKYHLVEINVSPTGGNSSSPIVVKRRLFCGRIGVGGLSSGSLGPVSSGVRNIFQSSL